MDQNRNIRVLVADYHPIWRVGMSRVLEQSTDLFVVGEFDNLSTAQAEIERLSPDVVLADTSATNLEALDSMAARFPTTPVLLLPERPEEISQLSMRFGTQVRGYLPKTASIDSLIEVIRLIHSGDSFIFSGDEAQSSAPIPSEGMRLYETLSHQEREVFTLLVENVSYSEIAELLSISRHTVQTCRQRIMGKLNLKDRADLLKFALHNGFLRIDR